MRILALVTATLLASLIGGTAEAQLNNRPYAFPNTPTGGVGISLAGRQAIFNEQFLGARPEFFVRDATGSLLDVRRAPEGLAVLQRPGDGNFVPSSRGTASFRGGNVGISVGSFNSFFVPRRGGTNFAILPRQSTSEEAVTLWTTRVVSDAGVILGRPNVVNSWTGFVSGLSVVR
ncbi:MAG: hypothetical protein AAGE80_05215 [Pseudomonadota bacterium]